MTQDPNAEFDHAVLDKIELSPIGALPNTPAYQDALRRLYAARQIYAHADHKGGHVTARSLARLPLFCPQNLDAFAAGQLAEEALEPNFSVYDRYVQSLPAGFRQRAEAFRVTVIGKPILHRSRQGSATVHEPLHMLFLIPGAGPHPGLPGNYLHGSLFHVGADDATGTWEIHVHDADDGLAVFAARELKDALARLQEVLASAPFHLSELEGLEFAMR